MPGAFRMTVSFTLEVHDVLLSKKISVFIIEKHILAIVLLLV